MKNIFLIIIFLLFVSVALAEELLIDRVMVSIEGEPITQSEIVRFAKGQGKDVNGLDRLDPIMQGLVQEVVVQKLLDKEAEALNISVTNEEVETYLSEIRRQNEVDEATFRELLADRGIEWESYLKQIKTDIIKNRVVSARVRAKINVVDEDIARYLEAQPELRPSNGSRRVFEINLGTIQEQLAIEKREELLKVLSEQSEFDALPLLDMGARDLGYVLVEDLRPEIASALEETKDAQLSDVVSIDSRQTIYYVVGTISEDSPVDMVLSKEISAKVYEKKFNEKLRKFIDVELPARYHVEQL